MAAPVPVNAADLPEMAQAQIRHRCGDGCIRCGVTIHRFATLPVEDEPGWMEPSVVLLCPGCLGKLTGSPLEQSQYRVLLTRPVARDPQFDRSRLPYHAMLPKLRVGGPPLVRDTSIPIMIGGYSPIGFTPPVRSIGALRITLTLADVDGWPVPVINANLWSPPDESWTFEYRASRYIVESARSQSRAELEITAPDCITIVQIVSTMAGRRVELTPDWIEIDGNRMSGLVASGHLVGLYA